MTKKVEEDEKEQKQKAPSFWRRHDLVVLGFALALLVIGALTIRTMTTPKLIRFSSEGLSFQRPTGWLPGREVKPTQGSLAQRGAGFQAATAPSKENHRVYSSPHDPRRRIEVRIAPRPAYTNLRGSLSISRLNKYGEFYWVSESSDESINQRDWVRTQYRYAFKATKEGSPQIAKAVEYATLNDKRLYVVTVHGDVNEMGTLESSIAKSLRLETEEASP